MSSPARTRRRRALRDAARCPDCNSTVTVGSGSGGVDRLKIAHDPTCPWFVAHAEGQPFSRLWVVLPR